MDEYQAFSGRLEEVLKRRHIRKMYALAVTIGVDESAISRWRRGGRISTRNLAKLCEALDVSADWLLTGRGRMRIRRNDGTEWNELLTSKVENLDPAEGVRLAEIFLIIGAAFQAKALRDSALSSSALRPTQGKR